MKCIFNIADAWYCSTKGLVTLCGVALSTITDGNQRGSAKWQCIKNPEDRRELLVRYDTLAPKYQATVRRVLCGGVEPWEMKAKMTQDDLSERSMLSLTDLLELAVKDGFYRYVGLFDVADKKRAKSMARAAAVIETIGCYVQDQGKGWKPYTAFDEATDWIKHNWSDFSEWSTDVPQNSIRLKEKVMKRYTGVSAMKDLPGPGPVNITEIVYLKREDNQNREVYINKFPQPLAWAMQLATLGADRGGNPNYSDAHIIRKVIECCQANEIKAPSRSWFTDLFAKPLTKRLRSSYRWERGSVRAQRYSAYRPIEGAVHAGDCWMMDGTRVNMINHKAPDGTEKALYMVWVYDVYSGDVLGVNWCYNEDHISSINALKMAVEKTGYLPYELVFDKFPGHNTDQFGYKERGKTLTGICKALDEFGVKLTCTIEATGKAPIERFIGTFQDDFLQNSVYYYGQGVKSTRAAAHRTSDYLTRITKEAKRDGWDFNQAWQEANHWMQSYRLTPISHYSSKQIEQCPRDRHDESDKPLALALRPEQIVQLFWLTKELDIRSEMVRMTVLKQDVFYPITAETYSVLRHFDRVTVRYDETDLSGIHVFDPRTGAYLAYMEQGDKVKRYGIPNPLKDPARQAFLKNQQAIAEMNEQELNGQRAGGDDVVFLTAKRQPKALREVAEDRYQAERVPEQMAARFRKEKAPVVVAGNSDDLDIEQFIWNNV